MSDERSFFEERLVQELTMRPMMNALLTMLFLFCMQGAAFADYALPVAEDFFEKHNEALTIAVLTVDRFDEGVAHVTVHERLVGSFDGETVHGVVYKCEGESILQFGVKANQRYVMILIHGEMAEEQSFFAISEEDEVQLSSHYRDWFAFQKKSVPLDDFRLRAQALHDPSSASEEWLGWAPLVSPLDQIWVLDEMDGERIPEEEELTFMSRQDDLQGYGGCNWFGGQSEVDLDARALTLHLSWTARACAEDEKNQRESRYFKLLSSATSFEVKGKWLELSGPDGQLLFEQRPLKEVERRD